MPTSLNVCFKLFCSTNEILKDARRHCTKYNTNHHNQFYIHQLGILTKLKLESIYHLGCKFERKAKYNFNSWARMRAFIPALQHQKLYKVLVVPIALRNKWKFEVAVPLQFDAKGEIERFLRNSDQKICLEAKGVGLYVFGEEKMLNWKTGEISKITSDEDEFLPGVN